MSNAKPTNKVWQARISYTQTPIRCWEAEIFEGACLLRLLGHGRFEPEPWKAKAVVLEGSDRLFNFSFELP